MQPVRLSMYSPDVCIMVSQVMHFFTLSIQLEWLARLGFYTYPTDYIQRKCCHHSSHHCRLCTSIMLRSVFARCCTMYMYII